MSNFVNLLDIIYPINSMYITTSSVSPATSIGGTWTQITNGACLAAYDSTVGYTGSKTISYNQMPVHSHAQYVTANSGNPDIVRKDYQSDSSGAGALQYPQGCNTGNAGKGQDYYPYSYACKVYVRTA
nr:MAG TPA: baseplate protein [Caudoviricetes sp.]